MPPKNHQDALSRLRTALGVTHDEGFGEVTFYRTDGTTIVLDYIKVDSISPVAANNGVVCAEDSEGTIIHIPFVSYWTVEYRF